MRVYKGFQRGEGFQRHFYRVSEAIEWVTERRKEEFCSVSGGFGEFGTVLIGATGSFREFSTVWHYREFG